MRMYRFTSALLLVLALMAGGSLRAQPLQPQAVAPGVWFVQGEAALGSPANRNFISNAAFVVTAEGVVVVDALGSPARNKLVSQRRADAVKTYLEGNPRLKNLNILPVGYGSERPIADNVDPAGRRQNRRVEIRILRRLAPAPVSL